MSDNVAELAREAEALPDGWHLRRLGDVARLGGGTTPARSEVGYWDNATIPWATPSDITSLSSGVSTICGTESMVTERALTECSLSLNAPGTVLMTSRATIGFAAINTVPMTTNQGFITFNAGRDLDPEFLLHWLIAQRPNLVAAAGGSTFKELSRGTAKLLPISLPPLDEQRRIAEVLRSVDEAIAVKQATLAATKQFKRTCREAAVVRFLDCAPVALQSVLNSIDAGWSPDCETETANNGEWSVLKTSSVVWEGYDDNENKRLPAHLEPRPQLEVTVDDILITRAGPAERTGVVAIVRETVGRRMLSDKIIRLRVCSDKAVPLSIAELLSSDHVQAELIRSKSGMAASQNNISQKIVLRLEMHLPPLAEQQDFADEMAALQDAIELAEADLLATVQLKASVMSDLLSGRVRVPSAAAVTSSVPVAFKRAVFAAEIVHQLHNDNRFGSVKHEKIVHLCELHLGLQDDLARHSYKEAAGPYDPKARRSVERIFQQQKWFNATKPDGNRVVYAPLEKAGGHAEYFDRYFGEQKPAIQSIIDLMRPLDTPQCEIVATLYAIWNDFLIDGQHPTDDEIVASVGQWHPKKQEIGEDRWRRALPWMRQKGLVPKGVGEKTRVAQA